MRILGSFIQTPDEMKRYSIVYSDWLDPEETLSSASYEIDNVTTPPLAITSLTIADSFATFFVSGGVHQEVYKVVIEVETSDGQIKQDAIMFSIHDFTP